MIFRSQTGVSGEHRQALNCGGSKVCVQLLATCSLLVLRVEQDRGAGRWRVSSRRLHGLTRSTSLEIFHQLVGFDFRFFSIF